MKILSLLREGITILSLREGGAALGRKEVAVGVTDQVAR